MAYYNNQQFMQDVLGCGMSVNHTFDNMKTVSIHGNDKVYESIYTILSTRKGERFFEPEFGSDLYLALFEQNDLVAADLIEMYIRDALEAWEPRIEVTGVQVGFEGDDNIVPVTINFRYTESNLSDSYIYPFNIGEDGETMIYDMGDNINSYSEG